MFGCLFYPSLSSPNCLSPKKTEVLSSAVEAVEQIRYVFAAVSEEQHKATCLVCLVEQKLHGVLTAK